MFRIFISVTLIVLIAACNTTPTGVQKVLQDSKVNRNELEDVINHYKKLGNKEKLKAAYYLIGNMDGKYYLGGEIVTAYDSLFRYIDSLRQHKIRFPNNSSLINEKWDALVDLYGAPSSRIAEKKKDNESLSAQYLISHIDQAFMIRHQLPWVQQLTFDEFCRYILPYRIGTERPELWNINIFEEYKELRSEIEGRSRLEAVQYLHKHLKKRVTSNRVFDRYPFDIPESMMRLGRRGICKHLVDYTAMVMRANGLPVDIDYVPLWGNRNGGHFWNVLLQEDGSRFPFDAPGGLPFGEFLRPDYTVAKVYRRTFANLSGDGFADDIPPYLRNVNRIDVTKEYTQTFDIEVPITLPADLKKQHAVICTFNNREWQGQDYGSIRGNHATFKNMGASVAYLIMYYDNDVLYPASDPFILKEDGAISYILPEENQNMRLLRKFPRFSRIEDRQKNLLGARLQGANRADFRDSVTFLTITEAPDSVAHIPIDHPGKFRYVRLISGDVDWIDLGEAEFFGEQGSRLTGRELSYSEVGEHTYSMPRHLAFDGDLETYFSSPTTNTDPSWIGLDLGKPHRISEIRFAPRSDTNFILIGDTYELCYWVDGRWVSLGKQVADKQQLLFQQVPANALYLLHNLTKGREERIFTYENGKQIWW